MDESPRECQHIPVLLGPVIELLNCKPGGIYVDATIGAGGYARSILEKSAPDGVVLGLDWDREAIERVRERLSGYGKRLILGRLTLPTYGGYLASTTSGKSMESQPIWESRVFRSRTRSVDLVSSKKDRWICA